MSMDLAFNVVEHPWLAFIGALYMRDWKHGMAWWAIYQFITMAYIHLNEPVENLIVLFVTIPMMAWLGAIFGEWVSFWGPFPRMFDNRGIRDPFKRSYIWEPLVLGIGAALFFWSLLAFTGDLTGPCSLGLTVDQQTFLSWSALVLGLVAIIAPIVVAFSNTIVPDTIDRIDRRLSLKYLLIMGLRMAAHFIYDFGAMHGWDPLAYGIGYLVLIGFYWLIAYFYIGFVNVFRGCNRKFLVYRKEFHREEDRWVTPAQGQYFVVFVAVIDGISSGIVVGVDFFIPMNVTAVALAIVVVIAMLFWIVPLTAKPVAKCFKMSTRRLAKQMREYELFRIHSMGTGETEALR